MRLLIVSSEFPPGPGGIGSHAYQLARHLQRLGWHIRVVAPQDYADGSAVREFNAGLPFVVTTVPSGRGRAREAWLRAHVARQLVREERPDLLMGTGLSGVWVAAAVGAWTGIPAAAVAHGSEFGAPGRRGLSREGVASLVNRSAFERMAAVVAVSQFTRSILDQIGIRGARTMVIPNAGDAERFRILPDVDVRVFRSTTGFDGSPLLLTVGQVSERKGQEVVIRALPRIVSVFPNAQYVMVGLPTLKEPLLQLARNLGVENHVHFPGTVPVDELVSWLNCADVFVMTSRATITGDVEGFGIAVVESALCGTPAVVSRQSGLTEAIEDGVTGVAVPGNNPDATAEAVVALLRDAPRRDAMGAAARARALRDQTWETCAARYDALFRQVCAS